MKPLLQAGSQNVTKNALRSLGHEVKVAVTRYRPPTVTAIVAPQFRDSCWHNYQTCYAHEDVHTAARQVAHTRLTVSEINVLHEFSN